MMAAPPPHDGLLLRARYTPLRDVIRLRLTGRLNIRRQVLVAALPQPLSELVLEVVRRTRLSRMDKADVAQELIAHFSDGLESGATVEQLREHFGDVQQAARLIRRAKRRNQNVIQRLPRYSMYGLGVLAAVYLIMAIRFFSGSPNVAHDYLAELNATAAAVPPDQAAWPHYRSALVEMGALPQWPTSRPLSPSDPAWDEVKSFVRDNAQALAAVRQAANRPFLGYTAAFEFHEEDHVLWPWAGEAKDEGGEEVHPHDRLLIGALLPHLAEIRKLAMLLRYEAFFAAELGDGERVVSNVTALAGMAHQTREIPTLINQLVAFSILAIAIDIVGDVLVSHPDILNETMLTDLAHTLSAALNAGHLQLDISFERLWFADLLQHMYTDDGRGNGRLTAQGLEAFARVATIIDGPLGIDVPLVLQKLASPAAGLALANRRDMAARYEQLLTRAEAESRAPLWRHVDTVGPELRAMMEDPVQSVRYAPIVILMPSITRSAIQAELMTMRRDAVLAAIALHVHHRRHGHWPHSLDELTPHLLPSVPLDRFDGRPLRYALIDGSPVVYGIGANHEDNGGRPPTNVKPSHAMQWVDRATADKRRLESHAYGRQLLPDGDWVLWPPQHDPQMPD